MDPTPEKWLLLCSLAISCTSILLSAACAARYWRLAGRFTRVLKRRPPSESTLQRLSVDQAALSSSLDSLAVTVKRLSCRRGMAEKRERDAQEELPLNVSKSELRRRIFGSKSQAEIVAMARGG